MTTRSVTHATFVIERTYPASPARVFAAFSVKEEKERWFSCHDNGTYELDFRAGGREYFQGGPTGGTVYTNRTQFLNIVPNERIIYSYDMDADGAPISASLVTIEFRPHGTGTTLVFTEQGAFLDGLDMPAQREHGTAVGLDKLGDIVAQVSVHA